MSSTALAMCETSGSFVRVSGVGTQMLMTSRRVSWPKSLEAWKRPASRCNTTACEGTSSMYEPPASRERTFASSMSKPVTVKPAFANSMARGRPT